MVGERGAGDDFAGQRGDVYDRPAASFEHASPYFLNEKERGSNVHGENPIEINRIDVGRFGSDDGAGCVHQHVDPALPLPGGCCYRTDPSEVTEVGGDREKPPPERHDRLFEACQFANGASGADYLNA